MIKFVAAMQRSTFNAKMHQIQNQLGSAPYPAGELYSAPPEGPDPLAGFKRVYF